MRTHPPRDDRSERIAEPIDDWRASTEIAGVGHCASSVRRFSRDGDGVPRRHAPDRRTMRSDVRVPAAVPATHSPATWAFSYGHDLRTESRPRPQIRPSVLRTQYSHLTGSRVGDFSCNGVAQTVLLGHDGIRIGQVDFLKRGAFRL